MLKVEQFCTLATSPSWQAWLYHYDQNGYKKFIKQLREARGCSQNTEIMKELLDEIRKQGGTDKLMEFIRSQYPHMIKSDTVEKQSVSSDEVFEYYNPMILSYPRRIIFEGSRKNLEEKIVGFVGDKIKYDSIIVGDKAYIEYLTTSDENIIDKVPEKNWQIKTYKRAKGQV